MKCLVWAIISTNGRNAQSFHNTHSSDQVLNIFHIMPSSMPLGLYQWKGFGRTNPDTRSLLDTWTLASKKPMYGLVHPSQWKGCTLSLYSSIRDHVVPTYSFIYSKLHRATLKVSTLYHLQMEGVQHAFTKTHWRGIMAWFQQTNLHSKLHATKWVPAPFHNIDW